MEEISRNSLENKYNGKDVLVIDHSHPHYGEKCVVLRFEIIGLLRKLAMRVKNQFDEEFFLFHENQVKIL